MKGFRAFLLRGNVVDLAVAVVVGAAFGAVVAALVKDLITPLIAAIGGKPDFAGLYQVNFRVPHDVAPGPQPLSITVNGAESNITKLVVR